MKIVKKHFSNNLQLADYEYCKMLNNEKAMCVSDNMMFNNKLKTTIVLFLIIFPVNLFAQCNQNYSWVTWSNFTGNSATGSVIYNGKPISLSMTSNFNFSSTSSIFNYSAFNAFKGTIPNSTVPCTTWSYGEGGTTTMCFSSQVENPVLLIASLGASGIPVSLSFSEPYVVLYDGGQMSYVNDTTINGAEGYAVILFPGSFNCVTIKSSTYEYYTNITWGLNPPLFPVTISGDLVGCDSINLTASGGVSYKWNGGDFRNTATNTFYKSGSYTVEVTDKNGCTATALRTIKINTSSTDTINKTINDSQLPYNWNSQICKQQGTYIAHYTNVAGCDSIVTLKLNVKELSSSTTTAAICSGDTYTFNGKKYSIANTYFDTLTNSVGRDSLACLILKVKQPTNSITKATITEGEHYLFNSTSYNSSGTYTIHLVNVAGCDSIATLELVVKPLSQFCSGSIGDPFINETFGFGPNYGPPLPSGSTSSLTYHAANCPLDGEYCITNYTSGCYPWPDVKWNTLKDHTGDVNGYFMLVNASYTPSDFYIKNVSGLCEGTVYKFAAWIMNVCGNGGNQPNITFTIEKKDGTILATNQSGNIPSTSQPIWKEYSLYFKTPSDVSDVILRMRNNAPGGIGNDLALDDITFRPVGPSIKIDAIGYTKDTISLCKSIKNKIVLKSTVETCYAKNSYQWQVSTNNGSKWEDIVGAIYDTCTVEVPTESKLVKYRLAVAEEGNILNSLCRVLSTGLVIIIHSPTNSEIDKTICEGDAFSFNGKNYTNEGVYNIHFTNSVGCDSIITLNLKIKQASKSLTNISICEGDNYSFNGTSYTTAGTYECHLKNVAGCDSTATLILTVNQPTNSTTKAAICNGSSYQFNGKAYTSAGTYTANLTNAAGCDSTATLNLTIKLPTSSVTNAEICNGDSYAFNGIKYNTAGNYIAHLSNAADCDSTATLNLKIKQPTSSVTNATICQGDSYSFNGNIYNTEGNYSVYLKNTQECDSTVILNLKVDTKYTLSQDIYLLVGENYLINGHIYNQNGTYTDNLRTTNGCDSTITTTITIVDVPNTFSPNGDGINDVFMKGQHIKVFNRNGILMYEGIDGWDGTYKGSQAQKDTYFFEVSITVGTESKTKSGYLTLVR